MQFFITNHYRYIFILLIVLIMFLAFYLGTIYGQENRGDKIVLSCSEDVLHSLSIPVNKITSNIDNKIENSKTNQTGVFFGSKNGTKYYTPGCTAGNRIKSENIIWFDNAEDATLQGYSPANC